MNEQITDCRTETGVTVGIIDSIITMCRLLKGRDLSSVEVQEALKDLRADEDFGELWRTPDTEYSFMVDGKEFNSTVSVAWGKDIRSLAVIPKDYDLFLDSHIVEDEDLVFLPGKHLVTVPRQINDN